MKPTATGGKAAQATQAPSRSSSAPVAGDNPGAEATGSNGGSSESSSSDGSGSESGSGGGSAFHRLPDGSAYGLGSGGPAGNYDGSGSSSGIAVVSAAPSSGETQRVAKEAAAEADRQRNDATSATTGDLEWAAAGAENQGKVRDKGGEWREPTQDELLTLQGVDPEAGIAGGRRGPAATQLIPGAHPAPPRALNIEWGAVGSDEEGSVREPGGEWRWPTEEEEAQRPADTKPSPLAEQAEAQAEMLQRTAEESPLRAMVDLLKRNNAEILRMTGHTPTPELIAIEAGLDSLCENEAIEADDRGDGTSEGSLSTY